MSPTAGKPLVLASASPRRRELLARAGVAFEVRPADLLEDALPGEAPRALAERLAAEKSLAVARALSDEPGRLVLAADTIVVIDGEALGKPDDAPHAVRLLRRLVGRTHRVITAVALARAGGGVPRVVSVTSEVHMRRADDAEIRAYVATGEPLDKAGAYAAQGEGRRFIERIVGSETNVIGLPMDETLALLRDAGLASAAPPA
ncbi:MAG: septum formation protein Maf [Deltaproteobacteria bacterium]|nr:septum formation protein Maf [Deltaproteobacteria bacterium]